MAAQINAVLMVLSGMFNRGRLGCRATRVNARIRASAREVFAGFLQLPVVMIIRCVAQEISALSPLVTRAIIRQVLGSARSVVGGIKFVVPMLALSNATI